MRGFDSLLQTEVEHHLTRLVHGKRGNRLS